ncbi:MAG: hypothetical protein EXX96DRAFT_542834 [Benjaminiella poitrasii]|nr:MAG: hypothetical protein EXX96DRAFT_542834 [Benjaminiella poitrasii]
MTTVYTFNTECILELLLSLENVIMKLSLYYLYFASFSMLIQKTSHLVDCQPVQSNMSHLNEFLQSTSLQLGSTKKKVIVTGNDSADLDSIISSLLFAYLSDTISHDNDTLYIPLVKVPKIDLELRPEVKFVLSQVHVDYTKLICLDQLTVDPKDTQFVLVDHNSLTAPFDQPLWKNSSQQVVGVLDHHVDEKLYLDAPLRNIQMVGSCVTLVLDHFMKQASQETWLDDTIARLALAPLLVDTVNLKWELGRTTDLDVSVFHILQNQLNKSAQSVTANTADAYFKAIEKVKSQVDGMANLDILRRDYKEFLVGPYRIGTSAVTWHFRAWSKRESGESDKDGYQTITKAAWNFAQQRQLDMEVIFTAFDHDRDHVRSNNGDYRRELAVFVKSPALIDVKRELEANNDIRLVKNDEYKDEDSNMAFYDQGNVKMSRKQVWPLLKQLLEKSLQQSSSA